LNYSFLIKIKDHGLIYPVFSTLNYFWSFGFVTLICLVFQLISGIIISMFYSPNIDLAFLSIERFMREFKFGWLIRYFHSNGASIFFLFYFMYICLEVFILKVIINHYFD
jgi:ubiquinol-cytochrome c reductase cytochrome b subunit